MGERQVSVGNKTYALPKLFLVMATQNPIEQEGTFTLPEAQLDRFMMHVKIGYPDKETEKQILALNRRQALMTEQQQVAKERLSQEDIFTIRRAIYDVHMDPAVEEYLVQIVMATRHPAKLSEKLAPLIDYGASPRASIYLDRTARASAWIKNKDYVAPSDIHEVAHEILRHRVGLTFEAESRGFTTDQVIDEILTLLPLP
jgi:MoxR-like ATPase